MSSSLSESIYVCRAVPAFVIYIDVCNQKHTTVAQDSHNDLPLISMKTNHV